jgi:hypothetical protein
LFILCTDNHSYLMATGLDPKWTIMPTRQSFFSFTLATSPRHQRPVNLVLNLEQHGHSFKPQIPCIHWVSSPYRHARCMLAQTPAAFIPNAPCKCLFRLCIHIPLTPDGLHLLDERCHNVSVYGGILRNRVSLLASIWTTCGSASRILFLYKAGCAR